MKQRFYIDTSVFGGVFDVEFAAETALLFEKVKKGNIICVYSQITESELSKAPKKVRAFFKGLTDKQKEKVDITPQILKLAKTYIEEKVIGETSFDDCVHIAAATVHKVDLLVSWNFKHIKKQNRKPEKAALFFGYKQRYLFNSVTFFLFNLLRFNFRH